MYCSLANSTSVVGSVVELLYKISEGLFTSETVNSKDEFLLFCLYKSKSTYLPELNALKYESNSACSSAESVL